MRATISDGTSLKKILPTIKALAAEAKIRFTPSDLVISTMETAGAGHVYFQLRTCCADEEFDVVISLQQLLESIKKAKDGSPIVVRLEENKLVIEYDLPRKTRHELPIVDESSLGKDYDKVPKPTGFLTRTVLKASEFADAIDDAGKIGKATDLLSNAECLRIVSEDGEHQRKFSTELASESHEARECKSRFSTEYLALMSEPHKLYEMVEVQHAEDFPVLLSYHNDQSTLRLILAPRVTNA